MKKEVCGRRGKMNENLIRGKEGEMRNNFIDKKLFMFLLVGIFLVIVWGDGVEGSEDEKVR